MRRAAVVLVVAACWTSTSPTVRVPRVEPAKPIVPYVPPRRAVVVPMSEFEELLVPLISSRDQMCACGDQACAQSVTADFMRWTNEWQQSHPEAVHEFSNEERQQLEEIVRGFSECMMRANSGTPATP